MPSPIGLLRASMLAFLFGLAGIVIFLALTGGLRLRGLLSENGTAGLGGHRFSWARAQLLILSALALGYLLVRWAGAWDPSPAYTIGGTLVLMASHAAHLRSKQRQLKSNL
jgi:hypothetical protein